MAFAASNVKTISLGSVLGLAGDFTASKGDADGTVAVFGGRVYLCSFTDATGATPVNQSLPYGVTTNQTTNISTVTVNCSGGATAGRFIIIYS